jgi:hypothetical protein
MNSMLPGMSSEEPEEPEDRGRRLALGLTAGAGLIAVAVVAGVLLVIGAIELVTWWADRFD